MSKWCQATLSDICYKEKGSIISGPFGSNISSKYFVDSGIPVIRGNNLTLDYEKFIDDGFVYVTNEKAEELNCYATKGDLIFTAAGTIGQVGLIDDKCKYQKYVISNKQLRATVDTNKIDLLYAYYWFCSPWMQSYFIKNNKGSTVPLITLGELRDAPIWFPEDLNEQKQISSLFEAFSTKIDNNNYICRLLEDNAKMLYNYWFVQYDFPDEHGQPYKSNGGKMIWCEDLKREIPYEWKIGKLGDILQKCGTPISSKNVGTLPYTPMDMLPGYKMSFYNYTDNSEANSSLLAYKKKNILFGAMRPYFHRVCVAPYDGITRTTTFVLKEIIEGSLGFAYETLNQDYVVNYATAHSVGTQQPYAEWENNLAEMLMPIPPSSLIKQYSALIENYIDEVIRLSLENGELEKLRNMLISRIMDQKIIIQ